MHGTHVGRGAPAWAAVSTGHCAGPGRMPGTGVGAPKALGRAQQGRHSSELKGHLAERGGPVGLEAERVGCPGAVAGAVPGDPGEARTTCLRGWCHCGDLSSRGSRPPSLPRDPHDLPGFLFSHCSWLYSLELTSCGAGCLLASKEGLSSARGAGPGAHAQPLGPGSRLLWKMGLGEVALQAGTQIRSPCRLKPTGLRSGRESKANSQADSSGERLVLEGEPPKVCGSATNRRGGARRREPSLYGRCCVTAPRTSLEQASCPGEEGP